MTFITNIFSNGKAIFGILFPALFLIALAVLSIISYELLCRFGKAKLSEPAKYKVCEAIDGLCTLAVLTGSLQTIISLCIVGFSLWFGKLQVGTNAFAILIQGFASTGLGIALAMVGKVYLYFLIPERPDNNELLTRGHESKNQIGFTSRP